MTDTLIPENDAAAPADAKGKKGKKDKKEKGGKSNLVPAIVLALGILGGGYFMGQGGEGTAAAGPTTTEAPVLGEIATVEPININLKDGHFLRVGMALQLIEGIEKAEFEKGETSKANDVIIEMLGGSDMAEISTAEGREGVKKELKKELKEVYEGEVTDVFFTDFVMQ
ncbi:MAG TPA: flagellar basal body-associated FliL family protein [Microthrixaceae bacterium]|nr:flagellar basal body-associated FliL family protein [Microthrixaceae bacterium]